MSTIDRMVVATAEESLRGARNDEDNAWLAWHKAKEARRLAEENLLRVRRIAAGPRVESTP